MTRSEYGAWKGAAPVSVVFRIMYKANRVLIECCLWKVKEGGSEECCKHVNQTESRLLR